MKKKIYIISPREPSGATWLINCFLELGIKTYRVKESQMWIKTEYGYRLTKEEQILKQWLPVLSRKNIFSFRDDIEVQWTHEWPQEKFEGHQIIFFTRDPRDSLYSRFKRENSNLTYTEFIDFLDDKTLLNKIDNWLLFHSLWLKKSNLKVFRFEDYKENSYSTLNSILSWVQIEFSESMKNDALKNSTSEIAALTEKEYLKEVQSDSVINQGGIVGRWKLNKEETEIVNLQLENIGSYLLEKLNYSNVNQLSCERMLLTKISFNLCFIDFLMETQSNMNKDLEYRLTYDYLEVITGFINRLDSDIIVRSKLKTYEYNNIKQSYSRLMDVFILHLRDGKIKLESHRC